jgi:guanyl-specific ribonuclease Sa
VPVRLGRLRRVRRPLVALVALVAALGVGYGVQAVHRDSGAPRPSATATTRAPSAGLPTVELTSLPPQVAQTVRLIAVGGPFPYPHNDGVVFHNSEHALPAHAGGWYREYTVPTPGSSTRGARRIIRGQDGTLYWTADHYESFAIVDVRR